MALLERKDAIAEEGEPVGYRQPERLGLGIEMRIERARGEARLLRQAVDPGAAKTADAKASPGDYVALLSGFDSPRRRDTAPLHSLLDRPSFPNDLS